MTTMEKINLGLLVLGLASGVFFVGGLHQRVRSLETTKGDIEEARQQALEDIAKATAGFANPESLHSELFEWQQGGPEVQMISVKEGVCYLVSVRGKFEGGGEVVSVDRKGDFWFLHGRSAQSGVAAKARCWEFPASPSTSSE